MKTTALVILAALISTGARANTIVLDYHPIGTVVIDSLTGNDNFVQMTAHFDWTGSLTFGAAATGVFDTSNPFRMSVTRSIASLEIVFQPQWPSWPSFVYENYFLFGNMPPGDTYSKTGTDAAWYVPSFEVTDAVGERWLVNRTVAVYLTNNDPLEGSGNINIVETRVNLPDEASTAGLLLLGIGGLACGRRVCSG
jgi:hypothetical protein